MITYQKSGLLQNKLLVCTAPDYYIVLAKSPRFGFPRRLHSLLGGQWETIQSDNVDFNDLKPMQRCEVISGHGQANAPSNMSEGTSIFTFGVLNPYNQSLKHGFQIGGRENKIAIRVCGYDAWGSWLYITA